MFRRSIISLFFLVVFMAAGVAYGNAVLDAVKLSFLEGDYEKVQTAANAYLSSNNPSDSSTDEIRLYLGLSYLKKNNYSKAEEVLSSIAFNKTEKSLRDRAYLALGDAQYFQENYSQALETIKKLEKSGQDSDYKSMILYKLARIHLKLADWAKARDYLNKILTSYPQSWEVSYAKQLLEEKQYFAVQVGAYKERERAEEQVTELKKKDEYAYIVETTDSSNKRIYRVRVGQLKQLEDAKQLKQRLAKKGYPTQIYP